MCEYTGVRFATFRQTWTIDRLVLARLGPSAGMFPLTLHAEAHGVRFGVQVNNPVIQFMTHAMARPFSVYLDYARAPDGVLRAQASFSSATAGNVSLAAVIAGVPDQLGNAPEPPASLRLRSFRLHMDGRGFFEAYLLPALAGSLLGGSHDPAAAFATDKARAIAAVTATLEGRAASPASLVALTSAIASLPNPDKPFDLWIEPPQPLSFDTMTDPARLRDALPPGSVSASYSN